MNCEDSQEILSAFLDREETGDELTVALDHLYGCTECQSFFNSAVGIRSMAKRDTAQVPHELDDVILRRTGKRVENRVLSYRFRLPAFAVSAAAAMLMVISFMFGYVVQRDYYEKELRALMQAPPSRVVYGMNAVTVYPVTDHGKGGNK